MLTFGIVFNIYSHQIKIIQKLIILLKLWNQLNFTRIIVLLQHLIFTFIG